MVPLAPALFSTTTGWPSDSESLPPTRRAMKSAAPPGGTVTTRRIGLDGKSVCANAVEQTKSSERNRRMSGLYVALGECSDGASEPFRLLVHHEIGRALEDARLGVRKKFFRALEHEVEPVLRAAEEQCRHRQLARHGRVMPPYRAVGRREVLAGEDIPADREHGEAWIHPRVFALNAVPQHLQMPAVVARRVGRCVVR